MDGPTARPWVSSGGCVYQAEPKDNDGYPTNRIASMDRDNPNTSPVERDENSKLIAKAVNCHDDLLAALKDMQGWFELGCVAHLIRSDRGEAADYDRIVRNVRKIIVKATT